jgi:hypothetical protein
MTSPQFSTSRATRLLVVALEALFVVGMTAGWIGGLRFMVMERAEERVYSTLTNAALLSLALIIALDVFALFSPSLRRFALFGLGRLLIYVIVLFVVALITPLP